MIFPRDYQDQAARSILKYFVDSPGKKPLVVAPTGSGKSIIMSCFVQKCLRARPNLNIILVTHVAELLWQNCDKIMNMMPELVSKIGFYCESIGEKRIEQITLCSIQSIFKKAKAFPMPHILLIDECHLIPKKDTSMYQTFIKELLEINPKLGIAGFTATPFRTDSGFLTEGDAKIFDDICFDIPIRDLIDRGFHTKLISKSSAVQADLSNVKARGGDYILKDLEDVMNQNPLTVGAVNEMVKWGAERTKWLVFCAGVKHAENVRDEIRSRGITCELLHGETPKDERRDILKAFREGEIRAVTNFGVLTTGYDEPGIDMVALLRGTKSAGLYMQIVGRGSRPLPGKENCLILDFGGNIERFGPIDCITVRKRKGKAVLEKAPTKKCPQCGNVLPIKVKECDCGHQFEMLAKDHLPTASSQPVLSEPVEFEVNEVRYRRHKKKDGGTDSFRVDYLCDGAYNTISEYVCFEHDGFPRHKAFLWWHSHVAETWGAELPTVQDAILNQHKLKRPKRIRAVMENKFWRIIRTWFYEKDDEVVEYKSEGEIFNDEIGANIF